MPGHALHNLPDEADEVRSTQGILPPPGSALSRLPLQGLSIADLRSPDSQIPGHSHNIKPGLAGRVPRNASLQHTDNPLGEHVVITRTMGDRVRLQAVQLVQNATHSRIRNKMVDVAAVLVVVWRPGSLVDEGRCARKGVVCGADRLAVREGFAAEIGREACGEVFEGAQLGTDIDGL